MALVESHDIGVISINECFEINLDGFDKFNIRRHDGRGGAALIWKNNLPIKKCLDIAHDDVDFVCIEIVGKNVLVCSLYINPSIPRRPQRNGIDKILNLLVKTGKNFIILADWNCRTQMAGDNGWSPGTPQIGGGRA